MTDKRYWEVVDEKAQGARDIIESVPDFHLSKFLCNPSQPYSLGAWLSLETRVWVHVTDSSEVIKQKIVEHLNEIKNNVDQILERLS